MPPSPHTVLVCSFRTNVNIQNSVCWTADFTCKTQTQSTQNLARIESIANSKYVPKYLPIYIREKKNCVVVKLELERVMAFAGVTV